jgi:pseudaminic acid biosynthesis-associated methylase
MTAGQRQLDQWRGEFGDSYVDRNPASIQAVRQRVCCFATIFDHLRGHPPRSLLECGCNVGINLRALRQVTDAELYAVEPNAKARDMLIGDGVIPVGNLKNATLSELPFENGAFDLVFTSGVLIHIPDDILEQSCREMHRVAKSHLLSIEYFSPESITLKYRGHDDLLFKRDYGENWLRLFPDLEPVAQGFFWKRTTGLDNLTWWLFRKP